MYSYCHQKKSKNAQIAHCSEWIIWHKKGGDDVRDMMNFMANAYKDEGCHKNISNWIWWYQYQNTMGVGSKPYVVLTDKQLQGDAAKPGKEWGIAGAKYTNHISKNDVASDLEWKLSVNSHSGRKVNHWHYVYICIYHAQFSTWQYLHWLPMTGMLLNTFIILDIKQKIL